MNRRGLFSLIAAAFAGLLPDRKAKAEPRVLVSFLDVPNLSGFYLYHEGTDGVLSRDLVEYTSFGNGDILLVPGHTLALREEFGLFSVSVDGFPPIPVLTQAQSRERYAPHLYCTT